MTKEETDSVVKDFIELTARHTLALFNTLGLKTHIESMVIDDTTKEEYVFKFLKIGTGYKSKTDELAQKCLDQEKELASLRSELAEKEKEIAKRGEALAWADNELCRLRDLFEAADKVIEAYRSQIYNGTDGKKHLKALEVYDQLKNTKP